MKMRRQAVATVSRRELSARRSLRAKALTGRVSRILAGSAAIIALAAKLRDGPTVASLGGVIRAA